MTSRRSFLKAASTGSLLATLGPRAARTADLRLNEIEGRIARRDFRALIKEDLPTPSLILDSEIFDQNLRRMAEHSKATGLKLRPHVKIHKSVDVARRQLGLGAIGLTTATIAESELMSSSGLKGVFWTRQPAGRNNITRAVALSRRDSTFLLVVDYPIITELQCGSYIFMDTGYRKVGGKSNAAVYDDFGAALTVMTTVVSKRHPNQCTIDAGNKALLRPTDEAKGMPWITVENQGAEYGILKWKDGDRDLKLGERVELYPTNLDMSVNVYDRIYVARGEQIIDVWPIMGRSGAPQR